MIAAGSGRDGGGGGGVRNMQGVPGKLYNYKGVKFTS